ncbi:DUF4410 domain-containing protein [Sinorhizobium meliloti]|uniref:DUF4410 domain-containing protein n=1 Tax=Rhizobium meliloti TaxID=382 RepID=UPI0020918817|nr:DUF4410 domain-containing protein [Sinorhizobium meliloti]MCO5965069.1 DUF4410 domain-containing protein [Sinorhizobium meliloti]
MSKLSLVTALGAAIIVLAGCGARVTMTEPANVQNGKVDLVIVESKSGIGVNAPEYSDALVAAEQLEHLVLAELVERGIRAASGDSATGQRSFGAAGTALLALSVAKAERGSTAKRLLVGFGYGKSELEVEAQFLAPTMSERKLIAGFKTQAGSGYKPGLVMPLGMGAAVGGYVAVSSGVNIMTGIRRTPERDIKATAKAIAKTTADALRGVSN